MGFAFEDLDVWKRSLDYVDLMCGIAEQLPASENVDLKSQVKRAATSISIHIAEGTTEQTPVEQARSISMAIRSLIETVACQHIIARRNLLQDREPLRRAYADARALSSMLYALRARIAPAQQWPRDGGEPYPAPANGDEEP